MERPEHRLLTFAPLLAKRQPAKVLDPTLDTQRLAAQLIDHIQVLVYSRPFAIVILERWAAFLRGSVQTPTISATERKAIVRGEHS